LDIGVWVISVYFNIRNTLPKFFTFLPGHPILSKLTAQIKEVGQVSCSDINLFSAGRSN
jgi:hypothetical protein